MQHQKVINHIVNWLKSYADNASMDGFVVGVSGGIDSALTSTLCALTGKNLICLNMPIKQAPSQFDRSNEHIAWLKNNFENISSHTIDLTATFDQFSQDLPNQIQDHLTMANLRARLRMTCLYAFAGHNKYLVAGTGNKIEDFGVGFFTKYGDGGVDLSPIADLMKSEVYALSKHLGVVDSIINAKPTDGLWADNRGDEDQLGASYDELEWAMKYVDSKEPTQENLDERKKEVLEIYKRLNTANQHKMNPIPVCEIPKEYFN